MLAVEMLASFQKPKHTDTRCIQTVTHSSPVGALSDGVDIRHIRLHVVSHENTATRRALDAVLLGQIVTRPHSDLKR